MTCGCVPSPIDARAQLAVELDATLAPLRRTEAGYRSATGAAATGVRVLSGNHLWDAAHGYLDLLTAHGACLAWRSTNRSVAEPGGLSS